MKISGRQRKGISPIIATVLIIAATLIAFAAVAGYIFGLFGSSTKSAQAQVVGESLTAATGASNGLTMTFSNSGGQSVTITSVSVTIGGTTYSATPSTSSLAYTYTAGGVDVAGILPGVTTSVFIPNQLASSSLDGWTSALPSFNAGTTYTFSMALSNGITSTITVTAS
ncbi:MAG: type IV pilin N-terminal domain-containing protein [Nitrososphaerota archaeon]|nr:type IV pilin N-terminal domain-containing protein [Nitrososphaerota archaeon]